MILAVNLNAAVDKTYVISDLRLGHVNRVDAVRALAGGKGNNVARAAAGLGSEVLVTGFAGGTNGRYIVERLAADGIPADYMQIGQESRVCIAIPDSDGEDSTELLEPGPVISQDEAAAFKQKFRSLVVKAAVVTLSGSLPRGLVAEYYADLIRIAREAGCRTILDTNGDALRLGIEAHPDVIKPNREELERLLDMPLIDHRGVARAIRKIAPEVGIVLASMGEEGAVAGTADASWLAKVPPVKAINPVGSGDAMVAAMAAALAANLTTESSLALAVAAGAANALTLGAGQLRLADVERLKAQATVERIV